MSELSDGQVEGRCDPPAQALEDGESYVVYVAGEVCEADDCTLLWACRYFQMEEGVPRDLEGSNGAHW